MRFYWDVFRLSYAGHTFLSVCLAFDHACCLPHSAKQNGLRYVAFLFRRGSRSSFVRSRGVGTVIAHGWFTLGLCVSLWRSRRDYRGRWVTELAARPLCVFAQPHWLCGVFRREYAGAKCGSRTAAAPQTAPKSLRLSGLSSRCGGTVLVRIRRAVTRVHGKTRPSPIYARAGRAVLR